MQGFAALLMSAVVAVAPLARGTIGQANAVPLEGGEAYVAELDADWNVAREIRVPCPADQGCAVDLGLVESGLVAVHVRFDAMRAGSVEVTSRVEGRDGRASDAQTEKLALDRAGFGVGQYQTRVTGLGKAGTIILMAVKVPGWTAPVASPLAGGADRT